MKVLLDTHMLNRPLTGIGRYWVNLNKALRKISDIKVNCYDRSDKGLQRIFYGFNQVIKKTKPDLIHVSNFAPFIKTIPIITTVHDLCFNSCTSTYSLASLLAFRFFFKRSLVLSDAIICVSSIVKKQLLNYYSIDPKKIFIIYEGVDPVFQPLKNIKKLKEVIQRKFGIKNKYFLVVGDIRKRKNPEIIIEAFNKLTNKHQNIELVFAGNNLMGLKNNKIKFLNYVCDKDLNVLYNCSQAVIYSSVCEGFGLPLVEAMRCKTAVICSDTPVFQEITAGTAVVFKNEDQLFKAMETVLINEDTRKKLINVGYERSKYFRWEKTAKKVKKIYNLIRKRVGA